MDYVINATLTNFSLIENQTMNSTRNWRTEDSTYIQYHIPVYKQVINFYCVPILCVFGIVGNILSIIVLGRDDAMKKTTRFLLQNVAVADIAYLVASIFIVSPSMIAREHSLFSLLNIITMAYITPLWELLQMTAVYAVVIVTVDRYIAICHPLQSIKLSTIRNARWTVGITWFIAVIFNIPRFCEFELISYTCEDPDGVERMCYLIDITSAGLTTGTFLKVHDTYFIIVVKLCIPLVILIICNTKLIMAVRSSRARHGDTHRNQLNTTVMLVAIVILFVICVTPDLMLNIFVFYYDLIDWSIFMYLDVFARLLLVVNSSFNFIIYLARGQRFRRILRQMCVSKCHGMEPYLNLGLHREQVTGITRLRLSAHKLKIETDRYNYKNKYISPNLRICSNCNLNTPEDEEHFIIQCTKYIPAVISCCKNFLSLSDRNKFMWIMSCEHREIICALGVFINLAFKARDT